MSHRPTPTSPHRTTPDRTRMLLVITGIGLAADQLGKGWAFSSWRGPAVLREVVPGFLAGAQARNYGALFSIEGSGSALLRATLTLIGLVAIGIVIRWAARDREHWTGIHAIGGGLVLAGAIGNQLDRLALGYVRDYLVIWLLPHNIFNSGDVFMVLGALLLVGAWGLKSAGSWGRGAVGLFTLKNHPAST